MRRLVKSIFLISLFLFFCSAFVFAEEITITTYYPSPYGVYNTMRLYPQAGFAVGAACTRPGEMVYDSGVNQLLGCAGSTPVWLPMVGMSGWMDSGTVVSLINNTENVGIGTATPTNAKLQITSDLAIIGNIGIGGPSFRDMWFDGGTDGDFLFVNTGIATGKTTFTYDPDPPGGAMVDSITLKNNGNVGLGTGNPSYQLELSTDSAAKPSTNTWTIASDARIKKDIRPFTDGLEVVKQIRPIWFKYNGKAGFAADGKRHISVIGQEIKDTAPYTVHTYKTKLNPEDREETELFDFNSHALTFVLINSVKEMDKRIQNMDKENRELKARLALLEGRIIH